MILGAVRLRFANWGLTAGAIVYGTYGAGRLVSMALHGVPSQSLITATLIELGIATVLAVLRMNTASEQQHQAGRHFKNAPAWTTPHRSQTEPGIQAYDL